MLKPLKHFKNRFTLATKYRSDVIEPGSEE